MRLRCKLGIHRWAFVGFGDGGYTDQKMRCLCCNKEVSGWFTTPGSSGR